MLITNSTKTSKFIIKDIYIHQNSFLMVVLHTYQFRLNEFLVHLNEHNRNTCHHHSYIHYLFLCQGCFLHSILFQMKYILIVFYNYKFKGDKYMLKYNTYWTMMQLVRAIVSLRGRASMT